MPLQKKTKDIEHTLNKPLVVAIEQLSPGEWTIQPQADFRNEANDRFKVKDEKGNTLRQNVDGEWTTRRAAGTPTLHRVAKPSGSLCVRKKARFASPALWISRP